MLLAGIAHGTALDGGPFSILQSCLVALTHDGNLRELVRKASSNFLGSSKSIVSTMYQEFTVLLQAQEQTQEAAAAANICQAIAGCFMQSTSVFAAVSLLDPMLPYKSVLQPKEEGALPAAAFPTAAQLDALTKELQLSRVQQDRLMEGLHVLSRIQEPLDRKEAAIYARIEQLLRPSRDGRSATAAAERAAVAAAQGAAGAAGGAHGCGGDKARGSILAAAAAVPVHGLPAAAGAAAGARVEPGCATAAHWVDPHGLTGAAWGPAACSTSQATSSWCAELDFSAVDRVLEEMVEGGGRGEVTSAAQIGAAGAAEQTLGAAGNLVPRAAGGGPPAAGITRAEAGGWVAAGGNGACVKTAEGVAGTAAVAGSVGPAGIAAGGVDMYAVAGVGADTGAGSCSVQNPFDTLGRSSHDELLRLISDLKSVMYQLSWLDTCCIGFIVGQLSWKQMAQFTVAMYPHGPMVLFWARRLMTRNSRAWVDAVTAGGGGAAVGGAAGSGDAQGAATSGGLESSEGGAEAGGRGSG